MTAALLAGLQAQRLERFNWRTAFQVSGRLTLSEAMALDQYFRVFLSPGPCVGCGARLGARDLLDAMIGGGSFRWGLVHGEGSCARCSYPARAYHRDIGPISFLPLILQYHPDDLRDYSEESRQAAVAI